MQVAIQVAVARRPEVPRLCNPNPTAPVAANGPQPEIDREPMNRAEWDGPRPQACWSADPAPRRWRTAKAPLAAVDDHEPDRIAMAEGSTDPVKATRASSSTPALHPESNLLAHYRY